MTEHRSRILLAAGELYRSEGLDGFSMRKLAKRVGVTAPALYRHFENREAVLLELVAEAHRVMGQYLYRALAARTPLERLATAGEGYLDFALRHPRLYEMLHLSPSVLGVDGFPEDVAAQAAASGQFWKDRVRESVDAGILRDGASEDISLTFWAHSHGLISLWLQGVLPLSEPAFRDLYRASSRRIFLGLAEPAWLCAQAERIDESGVEDSGVAAGMDVAGLPTVGVA
jgi:AcrR family transcriptional regulator